MSALPAPTSEGWVPCSPLVPRPDPEHELRTRLSVERALREVPYYQRRLAAREAASSPSGSLEGALGAIPLLFKKDLRATLPRQWVPAGTDLRAELAAGSLLLVETSGSTGDRLRV